MAEHGVSEAELASAKRYPDRRIRVALRRQCAHRRAVARAAAGRRDPDYVNLRNDLVEAVTVEDIARVARRLLLPEDLTTVIAGRPEGLEPGD